MRSKSVHNTIECTWALCNEVNKMANVWFLEMELCTHRLFPGMTVCLNMHVHSGNSNVAWALHWPCNWICGYLPPRRHQWRWRWCTTACNDNAGSGIAGRSRFYYSKLQNWCCAKSRNAWQNVISWRSKKLKYGVVFIGSFVAYLNVFRSGTSSRLLFTASIKKHSQ